MMNPNPCYFCSTSVTSYCGDIAICWDCYEKYALDRSHYLKINKKPKENWTELDARIYHFVSQSITEEDARKKETLEVQPCSICDATTISSTVFGNRQSSIIFIHSGIKKDAENTDLNPCKTDAMLCLNKMMAGYGMYLSNFMHTYMYIHPVKAGDKDCIQKNFVRVLKVSRKKKMIVLVGAEAVKTYTEYGVLQVSGLVVQSKYWEGIPVMTTINPTAMASGKGVIGEIEFFVKRFNNYIRKYKYE